MGSTQSSSSQAALIEEEEEYVNGVTEQREELENQLMKKKKKKVLQQEPEMLPCHASASPLSPQLSTVGTPRLGLGSSSIKVWDPCNVLGPPPRQPPPPPITFSRSFSSDTLDEDQTMIITEVFLISHGDCGLLLINLRPDFMISGRRSSPEAAAAALTQIGKRQARALAVLLNSQGIRFNAVYSSPLDRTRTTAVSVCQELNFAEEQIQFSNELLEVSQGQWEGCTQSEIYNPEMLRLIDKTFQPDFSAPSGESLRQVEFRMIQFLNDKVLRLSEKLRLVDLSSFQQNNGNKGLLSRQNSQVHDRDGSTILPPTHSDLLYSTRQRSGLSRKKSGKSRLQFVKTTGSSEDYDENSCSQDHFQEVNGRSSSSCSFSVGVFSHAVPIKCLVTALLGCSPAMSHKICIDDSSITVLQHSLKTGWQIKRMNDTAHLRLL